MEAPVFTDRQRPGQPRAGSCGGLPLVVGVVGGGGVSPAGPPLDGVSHGVTGPPGSARLDFGDAEVGLQEEVQAAVRQQEGRLQHTEGGEPFVSFEIIIKTTCTENKTTQGCGGTQGCNLSAALLHICINQLVTIPGNPAAPGLTLHHKGH